MEKYFGIFAKDFDTQEVQEAKSRGVTSKKISQNEKKPAKKGPRPKRVAGSGSSKCSTSVGLIQITLDLNLTARKQAEMNQD
jgi:hypothetical protein